MAEDAGRSPLELTRGEASLLLTAALAVVLVGLGLLLRWNRETPVTVRLWAGVLSASLLCFRAVIVRIVAHANDQAEQATQNGATEHIERRTVPNTTFSWSTYRAAAGRLGVPTLVGVVIFVAAVGAIPATLATAIWGTKSDRPTITVPKFCPEDGTVHPPYCVDFRNYGITAP